LTKAFFIVVSLLFFMMGSVFIHYRMSDGKSQEEIVRHIVKLTKFSMPSFSVQYYEPRILLYEQASNPAYPQMQPIDKMELVYDK